MRAIIATESGPALQDFPMPVAMPGYVVVRVRAAALNRADLAMREGGSHGAAGGLGLPMGLEWSGEIAEVGPEVAGWQVGDRVMGAGPGAFSEFVVANAAWIHAVPETMLYTEAAALPVALQTMHDAIVSNGLFRPGQSVLIQGGSSAMGLMGMQIASFLGAAQVIGTARGGGGLARLGEFGADVAIDIAAADWVAQITRATRRKGVDLAVDLLAGPLVNGTMASVRVGGRWVNVGRVAGESGMLDFDLHSMRRITWVGVSFRTRTPAEISEVIARARADLYPALADGRIRMPVDQVFAFEHFDKAFDRMAQNAHFGKIVLSLI